MAAADGNPFIDFSKPGLPYKDIHTPEVILPDSSLVRGRQPAKRLWEAYLTGVAELFFQRFEADVRFLLSLQPYGSGIPPVFQKLDLSAWFPDVPGYGKGLAELMFSEDVPVCQALTDYLCRIVRFKCFEGIRVTLSEVKWFCARFCYRGSCKYTDSIVADGDIAACNIFACVSGEKGVYGPKHDDAWYYKVKWQDGIAKCCDPGLVFKFLENVYGYVCI